MTTTEEPKIEWPIVTEDGFIDPGNGYLYKQHEDGKYYAYDPETRKRTAGRPRVTLPKPGPYGFTVNGTPKKRPYPDQRKLPRIEQRKIYEKYRTRNRRKYQRLKEEIRDAEKKLKNTERMNNLIDRAPSSKDLQQAILALFEEYNFHPVEEMIQMIQSGELSTRDRISILKTLSDYYPKPKSIDVNGAIEQGLVLKVIDFQTASKAALAAPVTPVGPQALPTPQPEGETAPGTVPDEAYDEFEVEEYRG